MYFINQLENYDCGFTALKILLANLNKDSNYLYLPDAKKDEYSFSNLKDLAKKYNLVLEGYIYEDDINKYIGKIKNAISSIYNEKHAIIILKITKKYVHYIDPNIGKKKMKNSLFNDIWSHKVLEIENFKKTKCNFTPFQFLSLKDKIMISLFELIAGGVAFGGVLLVSQSLPIFVPIIFLLIYLLLEIFKRYYMASIMKNMDEKFLNNYCGKNQDDYWNYYIIYNDVKGSVFSYTCNIYMSLLSIVFIVALVAISGSFNFLYIIVPILSSLLNVFFVEPKVKKLHNDIMLFEKKIKCSENQRDFIENTHFANERAYQMGKIKTLYTYLSLALLIFSILLVMLISKTISISNLFFYVCIGTFINENLTTFSLSLSNQNAFKINKAKMVNILYEKSSGTNY